AGSTRTEGAVDEGVAVVVAAIEERRDERALRERERESLLILDTIPGLVAIMSTEGQVEFVNQQVLDYFGRTLDEMKEWGTSDGVHPDDLPVVIGAWTHSVETGDPYEFEHRIRRAD